MKQSAPRLVQWGSFVKSFLRMLTRSLPHTLHRARKTMTQSHFAFSCGNASLVYISYQQQFLLELYDSSVIVQIFFLVILSVLSAFKTIIILLLLTVPHWALSLVDCHYFQSVCCSKMDFKIHVFYGAISLRKNDEAECPVHGLCCYLHLN